MGTAVRLVRVLGPATLLLVGFAALMAALAIGGGAATPELIDPGAVVLYGLPIAKFVMNTGVALTIGALGLAVLALSPDRPEFGRALDIAAAGAGVWSVAGAVSAILAFQSIANVPFALDDSFGQV